MSSARFVSLQDHMASHDPVVLSCDIAIGSHDPSLSVHHSQGYSGGTTVSSTMVCAHKAGISVFVTGGIGGVHRAGERCELRLSSFIFLLFSFI